MRQIIPTILALCTLFSLHAASEDDSSAWDSTTYYDTAWQDQWNSSLDSTTWDSTTHSNSAWDSTTYYSTCDSSSHPGSSWDGYQSCSSWDSSYYDSSWNSYSWDSQCCTSSWSSDCCDSTWDSGYQGSSWNSQYYDSSWQDQWNSNYCGSSWDSSCYDSAWNSTYWDSSSNSGYWDSGCHGSSWDSWSSSGVCSYGIHSSGMDVLTRIFDRYYAGEFASFLSSLEDRWRERGDFGCNESSYLHSVGCPHGAMAELECLRRERDACLERIASNYPDTTMSKVIQEVFSFELTDREGDILRYFIFDRAVDNKELGGFSDEDWARFFDVLYEYRSKRELLREDLMLHTICEPAYHTYSIVLELNKRDRIATEFSDFGCPFISDLWDVDSLLKKFYAYKYNCNTMRALANGRIQPMTGAEWEVQDALMLYHDRLGDLVRAHG